MIFYVFYDGNDGSLESVDMRWSGHEYKDFTIKLNENFDERKLILLKYVRKAFDNNFKFHCNLHVPLHLLCAFPRFWKDITNCWNSSYSFLPTVRSAMSSQYLWFNTFIKIENKVVHYTNFWDNQINDVNDFFDRKGKLKSLQEQNIKKNLHVL